VVDKHASQLIADRIVQRHGDDAGVHASREAADHLALADLPRAPARSRAHPTYRHMRSPARHVALQKVLLPPAKLPSLTLGKGWAECPGDVAVPEIAFALRRCNKTGHNQQ
jgi:hypothetical protein